MRFRSRRDPVIGALLLALASVAVLDVRARRHAHEATALAAGATMADTVRLHVIDTIRLNVRDTVHDTVVVAVERIVERWRVDTLWRTVLAPQGRVAERSAAAHRSALPIAAYAVSLAGGDVANALFQFDPDRGGYRDTWATQDKWTHFAFGALLTQSAGEIGVPMRWAVPLTCAGAYGYELAQGRNGGYVSNRDAVASCTGALSAALFRRLLAGGVRR